MRYPKEAVMFEVTKRSLDGNLKVGTHVEAAGPCCINTDRAWKCGVLLINDYGIQEEDEFQGVANLRPLTKAARDMFALFEHK